MESFTEFIYFKLGTALRKTQKQFNYRYAREYGITVAQSFILFSLLECDGMNIKKLAERLSIDNSAITGLIDRLVKEGLVERRVDPEDRRAFRIFLTDKGCEMAERVYPIAHGFNEQLKSVLTPEQQSALNNLLEVIDRIE
ncbi:MAG: MarR family transcriptional regulator [Firmicutes bacterium]|nr:MarR family transcriptional regulator [Bacillota bacterium]